MTADQILDTARQTIVQQAESLTVLADQLGSPLVAAVRAIAECKGRVIATGVGKSGIVAQKIVATLNSTGTPAIFMHAADALHGDLGMVGAADVVLCLSKSGASAEICHLLPALRQRSACLIGVGAVLHSPLALQAAIFIHTPVAAEADPNNLAPTVSTTLQMVVGDAIAVCLMAMRGFSTNDFARLHPGGALGKQLLLRVADLYPHHARPSVPLNAPLRQVIFAISAARLGATAVLDAHGQLCGIITDGDLRRMLETTDQLATVTAADVMTPNPKTIAADALAMQALALLRKHAIHQLLVLENGRYVGVVHLHDLLREGLG